MKKLLFISVLLIILSCSKEEADIRLSEFETPIITGFELRDITGYTMGTIGTPNVKLGSESNSSDSEYYFNTYPNPSTRTCFLYIKIPNPNVITQVWVVEAQYSGSSIGTTTNLGNTTLLGNGGSPLIQAEFLSTKNDNTAALDLSGLGDGYYRIYVKVDDLILYDNLVITN